MTDDPRDERMAQRLRVEPLDEVTRARLVRTAMAAAETPPAASAKWASRGRVLGIAAVLVVLLAVGLGVLVRNDDSGSGPTAADAPKAANNGFERSAGDSTETLDESDLGAFSITTERDIRALGDLGDLGSAARIRRAVD